MLTHRYYIRLFGVSFAGLLREMPKYRIGALNSLSAVFLKALSWPNMPAGVSKRSGGAAGQLILLCGPSGVGKSSIASELAAARQLELLSQERT